LGYAITQIALVSWEVDPKQFSKPVLDPGTLLLKGATKTGELFEFLIPWYRFWRGFLGPSP